MNARKRTIRSEQEKLGRDESIAYESRYIRWAGTYAPETDPEEFLLHANLFVAGEMDRAERAYFEQAQSAIDQAVDVEIEEVYDLGNRLFSDPRGVPAPLYGTHRFKVKDPGGPSWGTETAPPLDAGKVVGKLESSAIGCFWMLGRLEELLENAQKHFWAAEDRLRMVRLLARNPVDGIADRRVAEVFAASYAIRPVGKPFDDLLSDMSEPVLEAHVQAVKAKWRDLSRKDEPEKARQSLIDMVEGEIERIRALAAEHEQNAGEDAVRIRALKAYQDSPKAVAMRREYVKYKGSLERGLVAVRREKRARKADSDAEALPPVPGKDISPYDGRPASWWRESAGGGKAGRRAAGGERRTDGEGAGDLRSGGGRGLETRAEQGETRAQQAEGGADLGECGSGGAIAAGCSGAAVESGLETPADGTRSVPATPIGKGRGWDSVVVEESDVVACGGYLPERYIAIAGGGDSEAETAAGLENEVPKLETTSSVPEEGGTNAERVGEVTQEVRAEGGDLGCDERACDGALDWSTRVDGERPATGAQQGGTAGKTAEKCENEANLCDDVCVVQHQEIVEVPANSGGVSEVDGCQTKPIFLETKPIPAVGPEAGGAGGSTKAEARHLTERERWDAWKEIRRREWIRSRAEKEAREREQRARLDAGVPDAGATSSTSGEAMPPHDVRGP